ncbi:MAG: hypothetical protein L3J06_05400 [Cyclobacteriaceae bacterium]|nr:hypothetical protein [Cyclobacteriaceae bacterium]
MKKIFLITLICALPYMGKAQITSVGLTVGVNIGGSTPYAFETGSYLIEFENVGTGGRFSPGTNLYLNFGAFLEHNLLKKYSLSHSIILHQYAPSYAILSKSNGVKTSETVGIFVITYTGMLRLFNKGGLRFLAGPGIDINSISATPPTFNDSNLNELVTQLQNTFNPVVFYIGAELGYRAGRIDIALKYNHSLNSLTNSLAYQGENYAIPTRQAFLFLNIGFLIFDKNLRDAKKK